MDEKKIDEKKLEEVTGGGPGDVRFYSDYCFTCRWRSHSDCPYRRAQWSGQKVDETVCIYKEEKK